MQYGVFDAVEVRFGLKGYTHDGQSDGLCWFCISTGQTVLHNMLSLAIRLLSVYRGIETLAGRIASSSTTCTLQASVLPLSRVAANK